jgi:polyisoprenoid-binding protein YceI
MAERLSRLRREHPLSHDFHRKACILALSAWSAVAAAAPAAWQVDPQRTQVHWEVRHFDTSTARGRFERIQAQLGFDPAARRGELAVTVDTASVSSGLAVFDKVLRGPYMLNAEAHPTAWFIARQFIFDGERLSTVRGELTLRGVSRGFELKALSFGCRAGTAEGGEVCGGDFEGELRRSDFGIDYAQPFAADRVRLFVSVQARRP